MTSADIRRSFLAYFETEGHRIVPSASLVPVDDPTLLFTNAGMNQFKDTFLGKERREYRRATTSQKCMRVSGKHNDLDNVGPSLRHHTFFEMLGNFSFGDYFKPEAIPFAWRLLTEVWKIPPERLYATVFVGEAGIPRDDEAYALWRTLLPSDRIVELGLAENFWAMGDAGPCGRCSELHYHRGDHHPCAEATCRGIDCSCDRYVEVWNNVFMEFERQPDGTLTPLPAPSIDTGMGLERIVAVLQDRLSNYDTDLFTPLLREIGAVTGTPYGPHEGRPSNDTTDVSVRVVADHVRAMTFLIADGVMPSNEWRGYVLRKIMRRAMRHGKRLGMTDPFLHLLVDVLVTEMGPAYPELGANRDAVVTVIQAEEERFDKVLNDGLPRLESVLAGATEGTRTIRGDDVFRLSDTYGLPLDFIEDLAQERGVGVDRDGFERALDGQREKSRAGQAFGHTTAQAFDFTPGSAGRELRETPDQFDGYTATVGDEVPILAIFDGERRQIDELGEGATGSVILARTPFYVEAGGQVSDTGQLRSVTGAVAAVTAMGRLAPGGPRVHGIRIETGRLTTGERVTPTVDTPRRDAIRRNHTATHLLQAALREILGSHVRQAGSLVAPDRLRFDFTHGDTLTAAQITAVESFVNRAVFGNTGVTTEIRKTEEAIADGATALFGEKYGDEVRVVSIPDVSVELCGGTHCRATGDIGPFVITQESGVAAGVRRIEALTGEGAVTHLQARRTALDGVVRTLAVPEDHALTAIERLMTEAKRLGREVERLKVQVAMGGGSGAGAGDETVIEGVTVVTKRVTGLEKPALRALADSMRDRLDRGVVVLASEQSGKVSVLVSVTKNLAGRVHAGRVVSAIAPIVGGKGGGRPDFAEAGGREPDKIDALFPKSQAVITEMLAGTGP
jgi:alanyl-tRNA synthetase